MNVPSKKALREALTSLAAAAEALPQNASSDASEAQTLVSAVDAAKALLAGFKK